MAWNDTETPLGEQNLVQFLVRVPRDLRDAFDAVARSQNVRRAEAVRDVMRKYVAENEEQLVALLKGVSNE